jgi:hypothetical protein
MDDAEDSKMREKRTERLWYDVCVRSRPCWILVLCLTLSAWDNGSGGTSVDQYPAFSAFYNCALLENQSVALISAGRKQYSPTRFDSVSLNKDSNAGDSLILLKRWKSYPIALIRTHTKLIALETTVESSGVHWHEDQLHIKTRAVICYI